ncbi:MAG: flagellar basal-body rod protein FlgG [Bacillota bacterium]|jgi:flagellar basal-body rod protein FlgG
MLRALWSGATGMAAQQFNIDNISNNLANVNTAGFKRQRVQFQDLFYQNLRTGRDTLASVGSGVRVAGTQRNFSQGPLERAGDSLSLAIEGEGFFTIEYPNGEYRYTRNGAFRLDSDGRLVTSDGYPVRIEGGSTIPRGLQELTIDRDGTITGKLDDSFQEFGQIALTVFANSSGLEAVGSNLFRDTPQSGEGIQVEPGHEGAGSILAGYLETSNVEIVSEMVNLIVAQRAFELNSKSVETADQMWSIANNIRR